MTDLSPGIVAACYIEACEAELDALKPGNVHRFAAGHGMDVAAFETSARVSAPEIAGLGQPVGRRVLRGVEATFASVGMNTNLGILLLAAPLAKAAQTASSITAGDAASSGAGRLHAAVRAVLAGMGPEDGTDVYRAIALASPGGLGERGDHDVRNAPSIGLVDAMRIAAEDDLVARQYARGFADVFALGVPALVAARADGGEGMWPAIACFLAFAARFPDSHVARKHGGPAADRLMHRMADMGKDLKHLRNPAARVRRLLAFDHALKAEGLNPGTSADLTVASIFADRLAEKLEEQGRG